MQSNQIKRIHPNTKRMIVARGGKRGKTAGRGGKGQTARAGNKRRPEWRDIIKRIPKLRGRGKNSNKSFREKPVVVNLKDLETVFADGDFVSPQSLLLKGLISTSSGQVPSVKILGNDTLSKVLNVSDCAVSASARESITKAGGKIEEMTEKTASKSKTEIKK